MKKKECKIEASTPKSKGQTVYAPECPFGRRKAAFTS